MTSAALAPQAARRPRRDVCVKVTEFAPTGYSELTLFNPPADAAVREILRRLDRGPRDVRVKTMKLGDVAILSGRRGEPVRPLAFIWEGMTAAEIDAGLDELARRGWVP